MTWMCGNKREATVEKLMRKMKRVPEAECNARHSDKSVFLKNGKHVVFFMLLIWIIDSPGTQVCKWSTLFTLCCTIYQNCFCVAVLSVLFLFKISVNFCLRNQ